MTYFRNAFLSLITAFLIVSVASAQSADELRSKISDRNDAIARLEAEIKQYQIDVEALGKEKDSLSNAIKTLDLSKKKLEADTKITENKIAAKNLEIKELSLQIGDKSERITDSRRLISQSLYTISQMNSASIIETILSQKSFSDMWSSADELTTLQATMQDRIVELESLKINLESNKKLTEKKKVELVTLQSDLKNQAKIIADNVREKNSILTETKNTEANYKQLLAVKEKQKDAFEKEIESLESALKIVIDPNSIPSSGSGVLKWPLDNVRVTQYFGNTSFSTQNPSVYKGSGHNGIDLAASIGTPVKAAASGVVSQVINTSIARKCGYGKWIVVRHPNGLSTLYAHLSLPTAVKGDNVYAGQIIGYSGNTGFTTGPHLHFGVYVTQGLQTIESKSCPGIIIPYAAYNAYLNPLSFL
ncbi:MAG: peptidoglycan DD-metalloendopeptidase family protein [Patescibacteria group bacterium]|mgnify:CR=1 FL=1